MKKKWEKNCKYSKFIQHLSKLICLISFAKKKTREILKTDSLEDLQKLGLALLKLKVLSLSKEDGNDLVKFSLPKIKEEKIYLGSSFKQGGLVCITKNQERKNDCKGVIFNIDDEMIEITLKNAQKFIQEGSRYNVIQEVDETSFRRIRDALHQTKIQPHAFFKSLITETDLINQQTFDTIGEELEKKLKITDTNPIKIEWFNQNLNESQRNAVEFALKQTHLAIIHGPPGTGKTTALVELILQLIERRMKLLVCASSNVAIDNVFSNLIKSDKFKNTYEKNDQNKFVRVGHLARIEKNIRKYSLDHIVSKQIEDVGLKNSPWSSLVINITKDVLQNSSIIFSTCNGASLIGPLKYFDREHKFDVVIIDECAQALESTAMIPLLVAKKLVIAGDHQQLPATVVSQEAADKGMGISLMEHLIERYKDSTDRVLRMLTVQYRMNDLINSWPSQYFYQNLLKSSPSVSSQHFKIFSNASNQFSDDYPVLRLIDTCGYFMYEIGSKNQISKSKGNEFEANIVCLIIKDLIDLGLQPEEIG